MNIAIIRTYGNVIDVNSYNCQEIGLAKSLTNLGHHVTVILAGKKSTHSQIISSNGSIVDIYNVRYVGSGNLSIFIGWKKIISKINPDVIQIHDIENIMNLRISKYAHNKTIPCIIICGVYYPSSNILVRLFKKAYNILFDRYTLKYVNNIGCKTESAAKYINNIRKCNAHITHIGLDVSKFDNAENIDWKARFNLSDSDKILLYVGRLNNKGRNPLFLLDLIKKLPTNYHLVYSGSGMLYDTIIHSAKLSGISNRVHLTGVLSQSQLPSLFECAHLFLLPSVFEIYGMVILESMYFGLPVVSTASAGAMTIIKDKENGYIIDSFDIDKWVQTIISTENIDISTIKSSASEHIQNYFTWDKTVNSFIALYQKAILAHENTSDK